MKIKISTDFATAPGPRYRAEGDHSGEEFRIDFLLPRLQDAIKAHETLLVDLDGTAGYGTSFLEEAFGGLIRENSFTLSQLEKHITIKSEEEPYLIEDIREYLKEADKQRAKR